MVESYIAAIGKTDDDEATGDGTMIALLKRLRSLLTSGGTFETDEITGALVTIPVQHHEVHEGETFYTSWKSPEGSNVADNATFGFLFIPAPGKIHHLTFDIECGADAEVLLLEDVGASASGTVWAFNNMYRPSDEITEALPFHSPTINATGTALVHTLIPGGTGGPRSGGGGERAETEWCLNPSKAYFIGGINRGGSAQPASVVVQAYQESA